MSESPTEVAKIPHALLERLTDPLGYAARYGQSRAEKVPVNYSTPFILDWLWLVVNRFVCACPVLLEDMKVIYEGSNVASYTYTQVDGLLSANNISSHRQVFPSNTGRWQMLLAVTSMKSRSWGISKLTIRVLSVNQVLICRHQSFVFQWQN